MSKQKNQLSIFDEPKHDVNCMLCSSLFHSGKVQYFSPNESDSGIENMLTDYSVRRYLKNIEQAEKIAKAKANSKKN